MTTQVELPEKLRPSSRLIRWAKIATASGLSLLAFGYLAGWAVGIFNPFAGKLRDFKNVVVDIHRGVISLDAINQTPLTDHVSVAGNSPYQLPLPPKLHSLTVDGVVHVLKNQSGELLLVFKTSRGHDRNMIGYLYASEGLSSTGIHQNDHEFPQDAITAFGGNLTVVKTDDPHWYKCSFGED